MPLSAQPNAGRPREIEGRNIYSVSPEYMASYARRFINNGVRLVGGCCGTTPEHIRQIKSAVRGAVAGGRRRAAPGAARPARPAAGGRRSRPVAPAEKSRHGATRWRAAQFVVSVELLPPRGHDADGARRAGAPAAHPRRRPRQHPRRPARERADERARPPSLVVQQQAGIETILHYACRDRNLLGMQSDLLGAHSMGVRNLLLVTGDPPRVGDYPDATAVFDVDSIGLTNVVARLNRGLDIGGQPIGQPTAFHIGVAVNPGALEPRARRCGASSTRSRRAPSSRSPSRCSTPPSFARVPASGSAASRIPILAGIMPLESLRHAEFMANEVPGVHVPEAVVERMRRAENAGRAAAEGHSDRARGRRRRSVRWCRDCRSRPRPGRSRRPSR